MFDKLNEKNINAINYEKADYPLNEYLAEITYEKIKQCQDVKNIYHWAKAKPLYIQPPSIFGK